MTPRKTLVAATLAITVASVAFRLLRVGGMDHTSLTFIGIPLLIVLVLIAVEPLTATGTIHQSIAIALCLSSIIFAEAMVCILFAAPLFFLVGALVGVLLRRREAARAERNARMLGVVLLAPLTLEGVVPGFEFDREEVVTVSRTVHAGAAEVRSALASPMRLDLTLPLFLQLGFPQPGRAAGEGLGLGDRRAVEFLHGHHPGTLVFEVAESAPDRVVFRAVSDDSYITHWLAWRSAEVNWSEVTPGVSRVSWTLRYRRRLDPAWYFAPLERYGARVTAGYLIETLATPRSEAR